MKTHKNKSRKCFTLLVAALTAGLLSLNAVSDETAGTREGVAKIIYQSQELHHGIFSYPSNTPARASAAPRLVYVSQAYGPAIHSYAHTGSEVTVPFNVHYVDTAYGQAIYSYEGRKAEGDVKIFPILFN